ncbi:MAG: hypothetical protein IK115_03815 [Lachnospiraceae bacterium]|nr:hypothetical protein [Lachnospiraceae bacterium]
MIFFLLLWKITGFYYVANDDITMHKLAAGTITGEPDAHLVFCSYLFGLMTSALFRLVPGIDWYGLLFIASIFLCFCLILSRSVEVLKAKKSLLPGGIEAAFLLFLLYTDSLMLFQFTVVAGILASTALFRLMSSRADKGIRDIGLAWLLLFLAGALRAKVFFMTLPLFVFTLIWKLMELLKDERPFFERTAWKERWEKHGRTLKGILAVSAVGILLFAGMRFMERKAYSAEPWKSYSEYKHARSLITDYYHWPEYEGNEAFWSSLGVSKEAHECISMYGMLPELDGEKIVRIAEYAGQQSTDQRKPGEKLSSMGELLLRSALSGECRVQHILLFLMLLMLLYRIVTEKTYKRWLILGGVMIQAAILLYLLYKERMPARIQMIYDYQLVLWGAGILMGEEKKKSRFPRLRYCLEAAVGCFLLFTALSQFKTELDVYHVNMNEYQEAASYIGSEAEKLFVLTPGTVSTLKKFTFREKDANLNTIGTTGWSVYSPWQEQRLLRLGLERDKHYLLYPDVYLLTKDLSRADKVNTYFRSKDLIDEDYQICDSFELSDGSLLYTLKWTEK